MQEKQLLRTWLKSRRVNMPAYEVQQKSELICDRLVSSFNWVSIKSVHCYHPIASLNEVDTTKFVEFINSEKMDLSLQAQTDELSNADQKYDAIIVPTLGFDSNGFRLGWGGGFYDKFLASQEKAIKIGLCFEAGHIKKLIPAEPHDVKLSFIVTEKRVYSFN